MDKWFRVCVPSIIIVSKRRAEEERIVQISNVIMKFPYKPK